MRVARADQHGVAVRRSLGHQFARDQSAAAATVFIHHRPAQRFAALERYGSRNHIGAAAGRVGDDPAYRAVGIIGLSTLSQHAADGHKAQRG